MINDCWWFAENCAAMHGDSSSLLVYMLLYVDWVNDSMSEPTTHSAALHVLCIANVVWAWETHFDVLSRGATAK